MPTLKRQSIGVVSSESIVSGIYSSLCLDATKLVFGVSDKARLKLIKLNTFFSNLGPKKGKQSKEEILHTIMKQSPQQQRLHVTRNLNVTCSKFRYNAFRKANNKCVDDSVRMHRLYWSAPLFPDPEDRVSHVEARHMFSYAQFISNKLIGLKYQSKPK